MDRRQSDRVTVIIPAWLRNEQDLLWLDEALESVIAQTLKCQCIIVENGSDFLPGIAGDITVIHSDKGLSKARNAGVKASVTEFFFPLDANDWLPPNALEVAVKKVPEKGFLYGSTMLFHGGRGSGDQHYYEAKPYDFAEIMKAVYFPCGTLQRKTDWETIGGWRESLEMLEDWDYWITAGEKGVCGTAITDLIYWYRQHGGIVQANTHTQQWEVTKKLIQSYHADVYKGVYPPMCCGNGSKKITRQTVVAPVAEKVVSLPGKQGMIPIQYVGGNAGKMSFYGPVTHIRYVAGGVQRQIYIDAKDATTGNRDKPGLLELTDRGKLIFKKVE